MFWSKSKPAASVQAGAPPVMTEYNPSALEKGKETDRRSSFSSDDSSSQSSPIKSFSVSLPQQPKTAHAAPESPSEISRTHSQTQSVDEYSSVGMQSFPVLSTNGHGRSKASRGPPGFFARHWFIIIVCVMTTLGVIGAIAAVMVKHNAQNTAAAIYVPANQASTASMMVTSYWVVENGSIISDPLQAATSTPTPTAS